MKIEKLIEVPPILRVFNGRIPRVQELEEVIEVCNSIPPETQIDVAVPVHDRMVSTRRLQY